MSRRSVTIDAKAGQTVEQPFELAGDPEVDALGPQPAARALGVEQHLDHQRLLGSL